MNTFRKRLSRTIPVFFAVLFLSIGIASAFPAPKAAAANSIKEPIVWVNNQHEYAVSANNVVFRPLGFICANAVGGGVDIFKGSGTSISIGDEGKPNNDKKIAVAKDTETGSGADTREVPSCGSNSGNLPASYAWVTSFKDGTNFALIINGTGKGGTGNKVDAQFKPVGGSHSTYAAFYEITGSGGIAKQNTVEEIKVDTSKDKYVDRDNSGDEKEDNTISEDNCPIKNWALRWIACPITVGASEAVLKLEELITGMLVSDVKEIFGSSTAGGALNQSESGKAYYQAWNSFRILAIALIIILAVIMVVSEATGLSFFDAYTIRKLLPRLLIAAIIIALSWWLMQFIVQLFNNLTVWLAGALSFPFESLMKNNSSPWSIVGQYAAGMAAFFVLGPFGVLSYVGTIFLAFLVGLITLIVRRILLILAIVMAPIFIALYISPNTQKFGKFWSSGFFGLLAMGVMFTLAVTGGQILSKVSADKDPFGLIGFVALVFPIVGLPIIFTKVAGSAASIIGFINNKATGGFDRLKNFRKGQVQQRGERAKMGNLFGGGVIRGGAAEKLNAATFRAGMGARSNFGFGAKGREAMEQKSSLLAGQYLKSDAGQAMQFNDNANQLLTYGSEAEARRNAARDWTNFRNADGTLNEEKFASANAAVKASGGYGGMPKQRAALLALAATATGFENAEEVVKNSARALGQNKSTLGATLATINAGAEKRHDYKLGTGKIIELGNMEADAMYGQADVNGTRPQGPSARMYRDAVVKAFDDVDPTTLARGDKKKSVENFASALSSHLSDSQRAVRSTTDGTQERRDADYELGASVKKINRFMESGVPYAPSSITQAFTQGVIKPDQGVLRTDGSRTGPEIIRNVTQNVQQNVQQNVTYRETTDASGNKVYVQEVQRSAAPSGASPAMREGFNDFESPRFRQDDDINNGVRGRRP